ncbi:MAG: hydrogenase 4 subunit B [Patescibacteria group bacterium]
MLELAASSIGLVILIGLFTVGAVGSLFLRTDKPANVWSSFFAIIGSVWGILFASLVFFFNREIIFSLTSSIFPLLSFSFHIDKLASFFIFTISLIALFCSIYGAGYIKHFYKKYDIGAFGFFYHLFILGMISVVIAANALFFLLAWEMMSLASYFLVVYDRHDTHNVKAGFLYLVMTHVATAFIIVAFLLLYKFTGSFDFALIRSNAELIPLWLKNTVFVLTLIGFGTKAGIIPFHIWLPSAHPAAPSHVSALMSGVMIKTGIYMMIRIFLDLLQPVPAWWGLTLLVIGSVSSLLGVLYALTEHDIKKLLAYHSIENIGIILLGLGSALTFYSLGMPSFALLGLVAALFHTLNHATFKSLLFLSAGSVINQTHTRNMEDYGGLIRYMPQTAVFFLIGSMAISGLPPFNGFFSEWLTFQALFQGIMHFAMMEKSIFLLAAGALAFTGGLALACFVKAFGVIFLARPRTKEAANSQESAWSLRVGMASLAILCLLFGLFSGSLVSWFTRVANGLRIFQGINSFVSSPTNQILVADNNFASVSAAGILAFLLIVLVLVLLVFKYVIHRQQKIKVGATWDCGVDLTPRMEITATGFARSIILIFKGVLRPSIQREVEYHDSQTRYLPKTITVVSGINNVYQQYFYQPLSKNVIAFAQSVRKIQNGNVNLYILYIFIALIILLFFV